jgi:hypothetical protein
MAVSSNVTDSVLKDNTEEEPRQGNTEPQYIGIDALVLLGLHNIFSQHQYFAGLHIFLLPCLQDLVVDILLVFILVLFVVLNLCSFALISLLHYAVLHQQVVGTQQQLVELLGHQWDAHLLLPLYYDERGVVVGFGFVVAEVGLRLLFL